MNDKDLSAAQYAQFIDDQAIDWQNVRRIEFLFYQRFHYEYPGPIHNLKQRLIVIPAENYGTQQVRDHYLAVNPSPVATRQTADRFGNRILEVEVSQVNHSISFELLMSIESEAHFTHPTAIDGDSIDYLLQYTPLTMPDSHIYAVVHQLQEDATSPHDLAQRINDWVYGAMRYQSGVTTVDTTAAEALALGQGMCQDYAHLMLSICRAAHLPAQYVSGHLLGEGGSHAWVEVFLPTEHGLERFAFDPTNNRHSHLGYITVAVGRDYRDVSPTSGSFIAPYGGQLTCSKRAGMTLIEYSNGVTLRGSITSKKPNRPL
ncbi:MAG: transglutaminase family protein [Chloroflexota bacterium]